jgi:WS/DGAT/MGAT family acyltransferase
MSAWEALMWRAERDARTSSTGILLEILEAAPEWSRLVSAHRRLADRFPRLCERVVEPPMPLVQPVWSGVEEFDVDLHLRMVELKPGSTERDLLDFCEELMTQPLDMTRPPWEGILVTGFDEGRAAYLFRFHHSLTDGTGLIQLMTLAHGDDGELGTSRSHRRPVQPVLTPWGVLTTRVGRRIGGLPREGLDQIRTGMRRAEKVIMRPATALRDAGTFVDSLRRMLSGPDTTGSPLFADRSMGPKFLTMDVDLTALRLAAKASSNSVNDAFVAAILGGVRIYHERHDVMVETVPVAMPVSLRKDDDPLGGNKFAGVRMAGPLAEQDPTARMAVIRDFVLNVRAEPALTFLDDLSPLLTKLPASAIIELSANLTSASDLQVSNIKGIGHPVFLAGKRVLRTYPLGPRPGVAAMVAMITYDGICCLGLNVDPAIFSDTDVLVDCLRQGFDEVLGLADTGGDS